MTATEQTLKAERANGKTGSTNKKQRAAGSDGGKRAHKDGAERLWQAADKRVGRISEKLADLLEAKSLEGSLNHMKVLVMLAERKRPRPEPVKKPRRPSLAAQLAAETQWREEQKSKE
jgi:hypothetical protein